MGKQSAATLFGVVGLLTSVAALYHVIHLLTSVATFLPCDRSQAVSKIWTDSAKASLEAAGTAPAELTTMKTIQNFDNRNNVLLPACFIMGQVMNPIVILPESAGLLAQRPTWN